MSLVVLWGLQAAALTIPQKSTLPLMDFVAREFFLFVRPRYYHAILGQDPAHEATGTVLFSRVEAMGGVGHEVVEHGKTTNDNHIYG